VETERVRLLRHCHGPVDPAAPVLVSEVDPEPHEASRGCERRTWPYRRFAEEIILAAGSQAELVVVPERDLPADMLLTATMSQHLLGDATEARTMLGWEEADPRTALRNTVEWNIANPPARPDLAFAPDDLRSTGP
jgi:hypothetical protein